jgi:nitrate reductase beta subunit
MEDLVQAMAALRVAFEIRHLPVPEIVVDRETAFALQSEYRMQPYAWHTKPMAYPFLFTAMGVTISVDPKRRRS